MTIKCHQNKDNRRKKMDISDHYKLQVKQHFLKEKSNRMKCGTLYNHRIKSIGHQVLNILEIISPMYLGANQ